MGKLLLKAGTHWITFENIGKSTESTGYKMGLIELTLLDAKEQARRDSAMLADTQRDIWMYYGRNHGHGHGHQDTLNLGMHAFGLDLVPDLGYPEFADSINTHRWEMGEQYDQP